MRLYLASLGAGTLVAILYRLINMLRGGPSL
jgi:xanthosine utilization system XapX-like protein